MSKSRKENPQKLTQLSSRSHPRHLVGKRTAQKDTITDITSDSQVNSNFPYRWSPASLTFNNYFYLFLYLFIYLFIFIIYTHVCAAWCWMGGWGVIVTTVQQTGFLTCMQQDSDLDCSSADQRLPNKLPGRLNHI